MTSLGWQRPQTLTLPWTTPPLMSNARLHHMQRSRIVADIRTTVGWLAKAHLKPVAKGVTITVIWTVTDRRRRDAGSLAPTGKAAIDGLVDAGILPDDDSTTVLEERYRIERATTRGIHLTIS